MPTPAAFIEADYGFVWKAHWPSFEHCCSESDFHRMVRADGNWQCIGCYAWISDEDHPDLFQQFLQRASWISHGYEGGAVNSPAAMLQF